MNKFSNIIETGKAIAAATCDSNNGLSPSEPGLDLILRDFNFLKTKFWLNTMLAKPSSGSVFGSNGGITLLSSVNTDEKNSFNRFACLTGSRVKVPSWSFSAPMPVLVENFLLAAYKIRQGYQS